MNRVVFDNIVALKRGEFHFYMPDREEERDCDWHWQQYEDDNPDPNPVRMANALEEPCLDFKPTVNAEYGPTYYAHCGWRTDLHGREEAMRRHPSARAL